MGWVMSKLLNKPDKKGEYTFETIEPLLQDDPGFYFGTQQKYTDRVNFFSNLQELVEKEIVLEKYKRSAMFSMPHGSTFSPTHSFKSISDKKATISATYKIGIPFKYYAHSKEWLKYLCTLYMVDVTECIIWYYKYKDNDIIEFIITIDGKGEYIIWK